MARNARASKALGPTGSEDLVVDDIDYWGIDAIWQNESVSGIYGAPPLFPSDCKSEHKIWRCCFLLLDKITGNTTQSQPKLTMTTAVMMVMIMMKVKNRSPNL